MLQKPEFITGCALLASGVLWGVLSHLYVKDIMPNNFHARF